MKRDRQAVIKTDDFKEKIGTQEEIKQRRGGMVSRLHRLLEAAHEKRTTFSPLREVTVAYATG